MAGCIDNKGDLAGSISQRPNLYPILYTLEEKGDEIISKADSIVLEMDIDKEIIKRHSSLHKSIIRGCMVLSQI